MSSKCSWCISPYRASVDEALAEGATVAEVCREYGLSRNQWRKHKDHIGSVPAPRSKPPDPVSPTVTLAGMRRDVLEGGGGPYTVIPRLEQLLIDVAAAKQKWQNKPATVVQLLRLERDVLNDVAKLRGEFPQRHSMDVGEWEEWHLVVAALMPYPKALRAVSAALTSDNNETRT
jgi:hypothetical protein